MAVPNYLAYATNLPPSPGLAGMQAGIKTFGELQQIKMQRQQATSEQQLRAHQMAAADLHSSELRHLYLGHRLADLASVDEKNRPAAYQKVRSELQGLGFPMEGMPLSYGPEAAKRIVSAANSTPIGLQERKFRQQILVQEMKNRAAIMAASARAGGMGAPSVGGQIITPMGAAQAQLSAGAIQPRPPSAVGAIPGAAPPAVAPAPPIGVAPSQAQGVAAQPPGLGVRPPSAPPGTIPGVQIRPTPTLGKAYQAAAGAAFSKEQAAAAQASEAAANVVHEIDAFMANAGKTAISTGPLSKYFLPWTAQGQLTEKAATRLSLGLLKAQKFSRPTNYELKFTGKGTLGLGMKPEAWRVLGPQLRVFNQRKAEYESFLNAANMVGINNLGMARRIWNRYKEENPLVNPDGSANPAAVSSWKRYLTPQAIQTELSLTPTKVGAERTILGPDGKRYTVSELKRIAAQGGGVQ